MQLLNETPVGTVMTTSELVNYHPGSVVSRTLSQTKMGTLTIFAFDEGGELSEHSAPYDATAFVIEGEAEVTIEDQKHKISAGEMLIMPANKLHSVKAIQKFKMILVMIRS